MYYINQLPHFLILIVTMVKLFHKYGNGNDNSFSIQEQDHTVAFEMLHSGNNNNHVANSGFTRMENLQ